MIGIEAMAQIANRTGHVEDGQNFTNIAHEYIKLWQGYGINYNAAYPHAELNYGNTSSYVLLYNIFGDKELGLDLVPQSVYDMQSEFYPTVMNKYGVPLDTRHTYTKGMGWYPDSLTRMANSFQRTGKFSAPRSLRKVPKICSPRLWPHGSIRLQQTTHSQICTTQSRES